MSSGILSKFDLLAIKKKEGKKNRIALDHCSYLGQGHQEPEATPGTPSHLLVVDFAMPEIKIRHLLSSLRNDTSSLLVGSSIKTVV